MDELVNPCVLHRPYKDAQPFLLPDLYRLFDKVSRTLLAAIARHLGLHGEAILDLLDVLPSGAAGSSVLTSEHVRIKGLAQEKHLRAVQVGGGFFTLLASIDWLELEVSVRGRFSQRGEC